MTFRSLLFVPGNRETRFGIALRAGADAVCIDLEDAVAPDQKSIARRTVFAFLAARGDVSAARSCLGIRINGIRGPDGLRDLAALADMTALPDFVMVPKVASEVELGIIADALPGVVLWPIVESAAGLVNAPCIALATGVAGILFGGVDFAAESGCTMDWESLLYARGALAVAKAGAGIELLDVPYLNVHDRENVEQSSLRAKAMGFTGRSCIHPAQVETVNRVFTPTPADIAHATRLIEAFKSAAGSAALMDGKLIEKPVVLAAQRVLDRAGL